jgi:hypothetical protein
MTQDQEGDVMGDDRRAGRIADAIAPLRVGAGFEAGHGTRVRRAQEFRFTPPEWRHRLCLDARPEDGVHTIKAVLVATLGG